MKKRLFCVLLMVGVQESLVGTMKAAKKRGIIDFQGQMLLQGAHDNVVVTLKPGN